MTAKFVAMVVLPAFGASYWALAALLSAPGGLQVLGFTAALNALLGAFLSLAPHYDGVANVMTDAEGNKTFQLDISKDPDALETLDEIIFKVNRQDA